MSKKIIIQKKDNKQYKAYIEKKPELWAGGANKIEAIGDLIMSYPDEFDLIIKSKKTEFTDEQCSSCG